jgi:hypothetical protein
MARMTRSDAFDILQRCKISGQSSFFSLSSSEVSCLLEEADKRKYKAPKNANGSRGRYFYAYIQRAIG